MTSTELDLAAIHLDDGAHASPEHGHCLLEVVSMFAKEPFTDRPACVSPYLRSFGIALNDRVSDERRQDLKRFIPLLVGTAGDGLDEQRRWLAADHTIRTLTPKWLDRANLPELAAKLRALDPITDRDTYQAARRVVEQVRDVTWPIRRDRYAKVRAAARKAVEEHLAKHGKTVAAAAAVADVAAAADAVAAADAAAAAAAAAAADVAAAAAAAAVAAAAADRYWKTRREAYDAIYPKVRAVYEERFGDLIAESWSDALGLFERLINPAA